MNHLQVAQRIARAAADKGWRVLIVGGWVRDKVLGAPSKDVDMEVYGHFHVDQLVHFLGQFGQVDAVGKSFGVLKLSVNDIDIDVSVPRRENKLGKGHKGFLVEPDPTMTSTEAAARRDFTWNALAHDPLTGQTLDPFGGVAALQARRLRHTGPAFAEDPLRVLRGMQFAGRFNLTADYSTVLLCRKLRDEYHSLAKERIWGEWQKWAAKSIKPSRGLVFLLRTGWLGFYPELDALVGLPQDHKHHPEGSAWQHTKAAVDAMSQICDREDIRGEERVVLVLAALCHDLGKPDTTEFNLEKGRLTSYGHDTKGEAPARSLLERIGCPDRIVDRVVALVTTHMRHVGFYTGGTPNEKIVRRLARDLEPATINEWAKVVEADHSGRPPLDGGLPESAAKIVEIAAELAVQDSAPKPILMGRHLIKQGWKPGPNFGPILKEAYEAQLDGTFHNIEGALDWLKGEINDLS